MLSKVWSLNWYKTSLASPCASTARWGATDYLAENPDCKATAIKQNYWKSVVQGKRFGEEKGCVLCLTLCLVLHALPWCLYTGTKEAPASLQELLCSLSWEPSELPDSLSSSFQDEDCRSHESFFSESQLACRDVVWQN